MSLTIILYITFDCCLFIYFFLSININIFLITQIRILFITINTEFNLQLLLTKKKIFRLLLIM
eukprot:UN11077